MKSLNGTNSMKVGYTVGLIFTVLLGIGSVVFYQERMLFIDPAFITFEIINSGWFVFSEHRYGAWVTQMFPLIGSKLGLSLKSILIGYSMSFYLFYLAVIYVSGHVLKQYKYAILFCLYLTLMASDVYFWPNNEVHQAVGWMTLFISLWAWMVSKPRMTPLWMHGLMIGSLFFATISHLLIIIPLGFLWIYSNIDFVRRYKMVDNKTLIYSVLILVGIAFRYWMSSDSWYDGNKLDGVQNTSLDSLIDAATGAQGKSFIKLLISRYWMLIIVSLAGFYQLISSRQFIKLGFVLLTSFVFYLLVTLTHTEAITQRNLFYFESQWMVLSIILATPFVMEVIPRMNTKFALSIMTLLFICQVPKFYQGYDKFSKRLNFIEMLAGNATHLSISKGYVLEPLDKDKLLMTWGLPIETLLLTQIDDRYETTTIKNLNNVSQLTTSKDSIHTAFKLVESQELNQDYFKIENEEYQPVLYFTK
jgi:hypothetical protein